MTWWLLFFIVLIVLVYLLPDVFIGGLKLDNKQPDRRNHYYNAIIWPDDIPTAKTGLKLPNGVKYMQSHLSMHGIDTSPMTLHLKNQMYDHNNKPIDGRIVSMVYSFKDGNWSTKGLKTSNPQPIDYYSFLVLLKALSKGVKDFRIASNTLYTKGYNAKDIWNVGQTQCLSRLGSSISLIADAYANELLEFKPTNVWNKSTTSPPTESLFSRFSSG